MKSRNRVNGRRKQSRLKGVVDWLSSSLGRLPVARCYDGDTG